MMLCELPNCHPYLKPQIMKTKILLICLISLIVVLSVTQCKKEEIQPSPNISLRGQSLEVIRANIKGDWSLQYEKGGVWANRVAYYHDHIYEFANNDQIKIIVNGNVAVDAKIRWKYETLSGKGKYTMNYGDDLNTLLPERIQNDTLVLSLAYSAEKIEYFFTRLNKRE